MDYIATASTGTGRRLMDNNTSNSSPAAQVSPSIVVIIIVLTIIFFLSAFLHLLIRWLARNPRRRRGMGSTVSNGVGGNRIVALTALQGQLQQLFSMQDAGMERALIEALPVFTFKSVMGGLKEGADCAICLCEFEGDDQLRLLPSCAHAFHTDCIDTWLLSHSTCPLCRTSLNPDCWLHCTPSSAHFIDFQGTDRTSSAPPTPIHLNDILVSIGAGSVGVGAGPLHPLGTSSRRSSSISYGVFAEESHSHSESVFRPPDSAFRAPEPTPLQPESASRRSDSTIRCSESAVRFLESTKTATPLPQSSTIDSTKSTSSSTHFASASSKPLPSQMSTSNELHTTANYSDSGHHDAPKPYPDISETRLNLDSGRLSYTSIGNHSLINDAVSEASSYGSGRRLSVQLGKCRYTKHNRISSLLKSRASSSRRTFSKGSYEYVVDSSSQIEILIPDNVNQLPKFPFMANSKKLNDLLNASGRTTGSTDSASSPAVAASQTLTTSTNASFRRLTCLSEEDAVVDAVTCPKRSLLSDNSSISWAALDLESSPNTSMRGNVGSDLASSPEQTLASKCAMATIKPKEGMVSGGSIGSDQSKRAVSFRLPHAATPASVRARLKASASRRSLSEGEAFAFWEPSGDNNGDNASTFGDDRSLMNSDSQRSSSFTKRTMEWLVGWQRRTVHPDGSSSGP